MHLNCGYVYSVAHPAILLSDCQIKNPMRAEDDFLLIHEFLSGQVHRSHSNTRSPGNTLAARGWEGLLSSINSTYISSYSFCYLYMVHLRLPFIGGETGLLNHKCMSS